MRVFSLAKDSQNDTNATRNYKLQHFLQNATLNEKCNTPILETKNAKSTDDSLRRIVCALFFLRIIFSLLSVRLRIVLYSLKEL